MFKKINIKKVQPNIIFVIENNLPCIKVTTNNVPRAHSAIWFWGLMLLLLTRAWVRPGGEQDVGHISLGLIRILLSCPHFYSVLGTLLYPTHSVLTGVLPPSISPIVSM